VKRHHKSSSLNRLKKSICVQKLHSLSASQFVSVEKKGEGKGSKEKKRKRRYFCSPKREKPHVGLGKKKGGGIWLCPTIRGLNRKKEGLRRPRPKSPSPALTKTHPPTKNLNFSRSCGRQCKIGGERNEA